MFSRSLARIGRKLLSGLEWPQLCPITVWIGIPLTLGKWKAPRTDEEWRWPRYDLRPSNPARFASPIKMPPNLLAKMDLTMQIPPIGCINVPPMNTYFENVNSIKARAKKMQ